MIIASNPLFVDFVNSDGPSVFLRGLARLTRPAINIPVADLWLKEASHDKGVFFKDDPCFPDGKGRELKAHDFVYALKRIANVKYMSQRWSDFDQKIIGLDDFREYTKGCRKGEVDYDRPVAGLYIEDDFTLVIKLHRPWPQLIYWLAYLPTAPMAKEAVDYYGSDIVKHPVGTGPYILKQWHRGIYLEAVRNPNYRDVFYPS